MKTLKMFYHGREEALARYKNMIRENEKVIFPKEFVKVHGMMFEAKHEVYLIRKRKKNDPTYTMLRNEYGELVEYSLESDKWLIMDKHKWNIEEGFWVYGFHPSFQRKTFKWIFDNKIAYDNDDKYNFKNIFLLNNKLIIEDSENLDIVICRTIGQCIKLYNKIEEWCAKRKMKYVIFSGNLAKSARRKDLIAKIIEITGWDQKKIERCTLFNDYSNRVRKPRPRVKIEGEVK